ncbi:DUF6153 family protein [Longispora sp. NPDC051575]|uniref:DUF6153 family protein n=1 Tax=Longispora sp. NPDC051575 TaxID=3154943 RepID=UPI00342A771D
MLAGRTPLRLLFLALLALGVIGMHTFGHPSDSHGAPPAMTGAHAQMAQHSMPAPIAVTQDAVNGAGMGMDPVDVCLAILAALTIVILVGVLRGFLRRPHVLGWRADRAWSTAGRGPPPPWRGLLLADLSVLRV